MALEVTGESARHSPVWFELQLLQLLDLLQLHTGGALSDVKSVAALRELHQQTHPPAAGGAIPAQGGAALCELSEHLLRGHLANALREWRRLMQTVEQEVKGAEQGDARGERGSGLFACTICACRALTDWAKKHWVIAGAHSSIQNFVAKVRGCPPVKPAAGRPHTVAALCAACRAAPRRRRRRRRQCAAQCHFDGCFAAKHLRAAGRSDEPGTANAELPLTILVKNREFQELDRQLRECKQTPPSSEPCSSNLKAANAPGQRCASVCALQPACDGASSGLGALAAPDASACAFAGRMTSRSSTTGAACSASCAIIRSAHPRR